MLASLFLLERWTNCDVRAADTIPILAWHGPPSNETTVERYREMAEAGFTQNFSGFPNNEAMARALDVGQATGIRLWVSVPELQTDPEGTVKRFMQHPALAGYYLRDEPGAGDFPGLSAWAKRIQAVDAVHPCYINLFPNYANGGQLGTANYRDYVSRFLAEVPVPFLSFDHYPVVGKSLRAEWYENLEIVSRAATEAKKPFWGFVLAVAHHPYPVATIEHLRLQAFSNLAYGAQVIQHFTYWTPKSTVWNFHMAPIESDGKKTEVYDRVKQINAEIRGLSGVFLGARVISVGHLGSVPAGAKAFEAAGAVREIRADGPTLVSLLEKGEARYLVVVNRALEGDRQVEITFAGGEAMSRVGKDGAISTVKDGKGVVTISPGDVVVYRWGKPD
jgi:hypothetical protein